MLDKLVPEVREVLEELVTEGMIRYYGWSTDELERVRTFAEGEHCAAIQNFLSVFYEYPEVITACEELNLACINKQPLAMGILTGKFTTDTVFPADDTRTSWDFKDARYAKRLDQVEAVRDVLTSDGRTLVQGALAWIWARSPSTIPIPGFKTVAQVEENAGAMAFGPLSDEQMKDIESVLNLQQEKET